ncbi:MAG: pyruvate kinase [Planctomycetota bacterium]|jgi:pyruvate kinase
MEDVFRFLSFSLWTTCVQTCRAPYLIYYQYDPPVESLHIYQYNKHLPSVNISMNINLRKKKTKIVATIGPSSWNQKTLEKMIKQGLNVVRLNFSHGTHSEHREALDHIRKASKATGKRVAVLQDLSGPKIRIGDVAVGGVTLKKGARFTFSTKAMIATTEGASISYKKLPFEIQKGQNIMIDDGKIHLQAEKISKKNGTISCKIIVGGFLKPRKGVNIPGAKLSVQSLTKKDKEDVLFGIKEKVDFIALSFVKTAKDVRDLRNILRKHKCKAHIIAKIETVEAMENIDSIIKEANGIMVARGDLAIEIGPEKVPVAQKYIIEECNRLGKPVITATQMLDSMEQNPIPTRAEVSDVANAIIDGTDAVMLSGETAMGTYPAESVATMARIAKDIEPLLDNKYLEYHGESKEVVDTITASVVRIANNVDAALIVVLTTSGSTAQMISRFKPHQRILALCTEGHIADRLILTWGCTSAHVQKPKTIESKLDDIRNYILKEKLASKGARIVLSFGLPFGVVGSTNTVQVMTL